jgi:hypothetical protein
MTEEKQKKGLIYTKEQLINIFTPIEKMNENFTYYSLITSKKPNIPINKTNMFKININAVNKLFFKKKKINPPFGWAKDKKGTKPKLDLPKELLSKKDIDLSSLWQYKDSEGVVHKGPFVLDKLIVWVEQGFSTLDLEICQEGDEVYYKMNDILKIAKFNTQKKRKINKTKKKSKKNRRKSQV